MTSSTIVPPSLQRRPYRAWPTSRPAMSLDTRRSTAASAPSPRKKNSPMWERSKSPASFRTERCSATIPAGYWIGISHPAKGTSLAARATCSSYSGVRRSASVTGLGGDRGESAIEDVAVGLEREHPSRLCDRDPPHLVVLVVVQGGVAADGLHEIEVDGLADALGARREPVLDLTERADRADVESGLLAHLAERGLLEGLLAVGRALREDPGAVGQAAGQGDLEAVGAMAVDDAARGDGTAHTAAAVPGCSRGRHAVLHARV